ncbi:MAG: hypothetical protein PHT99_03100 [Methanoregula sp.]|nr:hypothetical protein [Methanoregula sp.]
MHCSLCPFLTTRLMGLGYIFHEAECISNRLLAVVLVVVTLLGYTIVGAGNTNRPGPGACIYTNTAGRISGFVRSAPLSFFVPKAGREHPQTL